MSFETVNAYLDRKHDELRLLNGCLKDPLPLMRPRSVGEIIRHKFQLTAALKAEHVRHDWAVTETAWAHCGRRRSGPFEFSYDYQRADLDVRGPSFDGLGEEAARETIYTGSGMAAISALLLGSARVIAEAAILLLPGSYSETQELIETHARHLRPVMVECTLENAIASVSGPRILWLDSCAPGSGLHAALRCTSPALDLLVFDTTCFAASSGRVRRVMNWARRWGIPLVMVRSHTKLDSLGAEYGRLGSASFVHWQGSSALATGSKLETLPTEFRNAVRLLGGAALPAHFPPYIGSAAYRELTRRRMAAILRNGRRARRHFSSALPGLTEELRYAHGLYVTLGAKTPLDQAAARQAAADMSAELHHAGLPIQHAGSFGFDFAATEWFHDATSGRYSVRIAVADLPTERWDELTAAIATWWARHQGESGARRRSAAR